MKIALYIEDGLEQIVLTPETSTEKGILGKLSDGSREITIKHGSFYACRGGWTRYSEASFVGGYFGDRERKDDESTMIVLAQRIAARSDETVQPAQPEGQEPVPKDAPND